MQSQTLGTDESINSRETDRPVSCCWVTEGVRNIIKIFINLEPIAHCCYALQDVLE
jgi:hypothetical protein